jgi:autotransporter-associated beta strand protein
MGHRVSHTTKQNMRRVFLYTTALTSFALAIGASEQAEAQTFIWTGTTSDYNTAANWTPSAGAPPNSTTATAQFSNLGVNTVNLATPVTVDVMNFGADVNAPASYTLGGAGITLSGANAEILISGLDPTTFLATTVSQTINNAIAGSAPTGTNQLTQFNTTDAATLTLGGINTFTGDTSIQSGRLALVGQGSLANSFVSLGSLTSVLDISGVTTGSTSIGGLEYGLSTSSPNFVAVNLGANTLTIGGVGGLNGFNNLGGAVIAGSGGVNFGGDTLIFNTQTYTGATTVTAGTLELATTQFLSGFGIVASLANSSLVTVNAGANLQFFYVPLSGQNPVTSFSIKSLAGAGDVFQDVNTLILTNASSTFSGVIGFDPTTPGALPATGGLTIAGGKEILTGNSIYTGATTINSGATLQVDGSTASSATTVNGGGTLSGSGTVGAVTVMSGGTLAPGPGATPATMTTTGNLAFQSGAHYVVQVTPGAASSMQVNGSATLAGTVNASFAPGSYITKNYTIVSTTGGRTGTFDSLATVNLPAGFAASLTYSSTDAFLTLIGQLSNAGLNQNQQNVANGLNNFFNGGGALPPGFAQVFGLTGPGLGNALTQLSGEAATGGQQGAFQLMDQFLGLMLDPFVDGRGGIGGASGGAMGFAPERAAMPDEVALAYATALKAPAYKAPAFEQRWTLWGAAYGGYNRTSGDPAVVGSHDLSSRAGGFAAGMDYRVTRDTVVGFALAGAGTNWGLAQGLGGGRSDAFQAGAYAVTRSGPWYAGASIAATNYWMSTDRLALAGDHLTADFNAQSLGARVETGYRAPTAVGTFSPYAALQTQGFHTPDYREADINGGGFGLAFNARDARDTRSELGTRFDQQIAAERGYVLALRAKLAWGHDWVSDPSMTAVFQALPGASFIVNGAAPARDSALVSAGSELRFANGVSLIGKFDGELARGSQTYAGTGTVRVAW